MTFEELTKHLEIDGNPLLPNGYFPATAERSDELCTIDMIRRLQEKYNLFAEFYEAVQDGFSDLENDPYRKAYLDAVSLYFKDASIDEVLKIKYPPSVNTTASNMLPLLVHLPSVESTYDNYRRRGLTHEEAVTCLSIYAIYLREERDYRSKIVGISPVISNWMSRFTKCTIIYLGDYGLNFQPIKTPCDFPYILKNRTSGEYITVFANGYGVHKSGVPLGSKGAKDSGGAFKTRFEETSESYIGHLADTRYIDAIPQVFSKNEWELVLKAGDDVISTHIFWDSDFTPENIDYAFKRGIDKAIKAYPEYNFKALYCCSWLMSPEINDALGDKSKLSKFSSRFLRFPIVSDAGSVNAYVFPNNRGSDVCDYDEKTSLQRAVKKLLLDGKYVYDTCGVIPFPELKNK